MSVDIKVDMRGIEKMQKILENMQKNQLPFAMVGALNSTAYQAREAAVKEMRHVFDRPTSFVLKGLKYKKSTQKDLNASVGYRLWPGKSIQDGRAMIRPHVEGGKRGSKRAEIHLRNRGIIEGDEFLIPSRSAKLNKYGNMTQGWMNKMLSDLGAQFDSKQNTHSSKKATFFVGRFGKKQQKMIVRRVNKTRFIPFMIITKEPTYKKTFDFDGVIERTVQKNFKRNFKKSFDLAMATARR